MIFMPGDDLCVEIINDVEKKFGDETEGLTNGCDNTAMALSFTNQVKE